MAFPDNSDRDIVLRNIAEGVFQLHAIANLLHTQIALLVLIFVGFVLTKRNAINKEFRAMLTDLIINVILPCNMVTSFMTGFSSEIFRACIAILVVSIIAQVATFFLGKLLYGRAPEGKRSTLQYATMVSNAAFLGNPIVEGLYGTQGLLYASVYVVPQRVMMWSAGVACFTGSSGKGVLRKVLTHPCILAVWVGLFLMLTGIQLPMWADKSLHMVGNCNTALSLFVVGGILAELDPKSIFSKDTLCFCLLRLALIPAAVYISCRLAGVADLATQTATTLAGMPAPITSAMLASKYGSDEKFAVSLVFLSTIISMVSVPALSLLMAVL